MDPLWTRRQFIQKSAAGMAALTIPFALGSRAYGKGTPPNPPSDEVTMPMKNYFSQFGIDETTIRPVLSKAMGRGGERAELFFQHLMSHSFYLEDGQVNSASTGVDLGMGARVVMGDQVGYAFTEELSPESMLISAGTASVIADGKALVPPVGFGRPPIADYYPIKERWEEIGAKTKVPILQKINAIALKEDSRIKKVTVSFADQASFILIVTSDGRWVEDYQPMTFCYVNCLAEQDGKREECFYRFGGRAGMEVYTEAFITNLAREAVRRTITLFDAVQAPAGEMPVVLASGSSGILLHEAIGHGMEADFNRKKISIYSDRMGKKIAREFVSIVDDATNPNLRGSINVDDEGEATEKTLLVENGVLKSYLHDFISARYYKVKPTGSGRRQSFRYPPIPRMRNTYMLPGPHKKEEIIASVKKGLYAITFTNGQVQIGAGDFTFYVKNGYLIEDGKLTRPVKDVNIIGNGPECLERVDMVGDDLRMDDEGWTCGKAGQGVPVGLGLPTIRISAITVGGMKG